MNTILTIIWFIILFLVFGCGYLACPNIRQFIGTCKMWIAFCIKLPYNKIRYNLIYKTIKKLLRRKK